MFMSNQGFFYSFVDGASNGTSNQTFVSGFSGYIHVMASAPAQIDQLSDAQWDLAAGEAYYLGATEVSDWINVNGFTHDAWEPLATLYPDETYVRDGTEITERLSWTNNLGEATYGGVSRDLTTYFDVDAGSGVPHVEALSTSQLRDIWLVSRNLEQLVMGGESDGVSSGYGLDHGYYTSINLFHSGIDFEGDGSHANATNASESDIVYAPVTGEIVFVRVNQTSGLNRVLIRDVENDTVWLLGHIHANEATKQLWNNRSETPPEVVQGTAIGFLADFNGSGTFFDHLHLEIQEYDETRFNQETGTYQWDATDANGWGQYSELGNALDRTLNPLQAFYDYDNEAALRDRTNISVAEADVTYSASTDFGSFGGGGALAPNSLSTVALVAPSIVTTSFETEVAVTVLNNGSNVMNGGGAFFVILSEDAILDSDDLVIAQEVFDGELDVGLSYTAVLDVDWSQVAEDGNYFIFAGYLDPNDETLDDRYILREVEIRSDSITDMTIRSATLQQTSFLAGQNIDISILTQNLGDRTSGQSQLVLEVRNGSDWLQIGNTSVVSLTGGARTVDTLSGRLPSGFDGNVDIRVRLENSRDVDTANNLVRFDTISVVQPAQPVEINSPDLSTDTNINASIDNVNEADTYTFTTGAGGLHMLTFNQPDYLELRVYNSNGQQLVTPRLDRVRYDDTEFMFQAPTAGTYSIEITSNGSYTGSYNLQISDDLQDTPFRYTEDGEFVYASRYIDATYELLGGDDLFDGQSGIDIVYGRGGDDRIETGGGDDSLFGGSGIDNLFGQSGNDRLHGGDAFDYLDGGSGNDVIYGDAGSDFIVNLGDGNDTAYGGTGDDTFQRRDLGGSATIYGGDGQDQISFQGFSADITVDLEVGSQQGAGLGGDSYFSIENINGSDGNDSLFGNSVANVIFGGNGNDSLYGRAGDDRLLGQSGNDVLYGGAGNDYLSPSSGADTVYGGDGNDIVNVTSFEGDILWGGEGDLDTLRLGFSFEDLIYDIGETGAVTFTDASSSYVVAQEFEIYEFSDRTITSSELTSLTETAVSLVPVSGYHEGTDAEDWVWGSVGNDVIYARSGDDLIQTFAGNDKVYTGSGSDKVELGDGNDYVRVGGGVEEFHGGSGKDYISYYDSSGGVNINLATNVISGSWASNDTISGFESASGSKTGGDTIYGTSGSNTIKTYGGNDKVYAGSGTDKVELGDGDDYVRVGGGTESFDGGSGKDYISYYDSTGGITIDLTANTVTGSWANNDTIKSFESVSGSKTGGDTIYGTSGSNTIKTYGGDDKVYAGAGTDKVELGDGDDYVRVGGGTESFDGGSGKDYISYYDSTGGIRIDLEADSVSGSWAVNDTIKDFECHVGHFWFKHAQRIWRRRQALWPQW